MISKGKWEVLKKSEFEGSKDKKKRCTWFKQGSIEEWWGNMLSRDSDDNDYNKNFFSWMNFLMIWFLILVQISYRLIQ